MKHRFGIEMAERRGQRGYDAATRRRRTAERLSLELCGAPRIILYGDRLDDARVEFAERLEREIREAPDPPEWDTERWKLEGLIRENRTPIGLASSSPTCANTKERSS